MIRKLSLLALIAATTCTSCQESKPKPEKEQLTETTTKSEKLLAKLGAPKPSFAKDSILLSFTVVNNADSIQQFCRWETPFEPRIGKYLEIKDNEGKEATFMGAMARRVMPPPAETYIKVPAHDSVTTVFNVSTNYTVQGGDYTVKYTGGGVSGLETSNELKINVKK